MTAIQYFDYSLSFEESSKLFVEQKEITYCYSKYPQFYCNVLSSLLSKLQSKIITMCILVLKFRFFKISSKSDIVLSPSSVGTILNY